MKRNITFLLGMVLFITACGPTTVDNTIPVEGDGSTAQPLNFEDFKKEVDKKFAADKMLPTETIFKIINTVPEQGKTPWSCGKVQISVALVSAYIALAKPIESKVTECNIVKNYPLFINIGMTDAEKKILEGGLKAMVSFAPNFSFKPDFEKEDNKFFFRVGALPYNMPAYINSELPNGMEARYLGEDKLKKDELLKVINDSLDNNMPPIALYVNDAKKASLHYYSIIGYKTSEDKIFVLETSGKDINRIIDFGIQPFLDRMNTADFKDEMRKIIKYKSKLMPFLPKHASLPETSEIDKLANYNLITFKKK